MAALSLLVRLPILILRPTFARLIDGQNKLDLVGRDELLVDRFLKWSERTENDVVLLLGKLVGDDVLGSSEEHERQQRANESHASKRPLDDLSAVGIRLQGVFDTECKVV